MKKKALIFGVTGQDGSYLSKFLLKKGYVVHGVKRRSSSLNTFRIDDIYFGVPSGGGPLGNQGFCLESLDEQCTSRVQDTNIIQRFNLTITGQLVYADVINIPILFLFDVFLCKAKYEALIPVTYFNRIYVF